MEKFFSWFSNLYLFLRFVLNDAGKEYGVGRLRKWRLGRKIIKNNRQVKSLSSWQQHLLMAEEILLLPESLKGDVIECGCFNGASTVNLSWACALTHRRLFVCDSFAGLSQPDQEEKYEVLSDLNSYYVYKKGDYSSDGGLEGVKQNVAQYGRPEVCRFVKGYFNETLKDLETDKIAMVFEDADLASSVKDCLIHLWPKLQEGCKFYCHEPFSVNVVAVFYNQQWWQENFKTECPGFYGSGKGINYAFNHSTLGYAWKVDPERVKQSQRQLKVRFRQRQDGSWKAVAGLKKKAKEAQAQSDNKSLIYES